MTVLYDGNITDEAGNPVLGAKVYIYNSLGALAALTDQLAASVENPVTTGLDGYWSCYIADGVYTNKVVYEGRERLREARNIAGVPGTIDVAVGSFGETIIARDNAGQVLVDLGLSASGGAALVGSPQGGTIADFVNTFIPGPKLFGVIGDGAANDTVAWQAWIDHCETNNLPLIVRQKLRSRINDTLNIAGSEVTLVGYGPYSLPIDMGLVTFEYFGTRTKPAISIGTAPNGTLGANIIAHTEVKLPFVSVNGAVTWLSTSRNGLHSSDTAIRLRRLFQCRIYEPLVANFTKGIEYVGCPYNSIYGMHISDCKYGRIFTTEGTDPDDSFSNENIVYGGKIGHSSNSNGLGFAALQVYTWDGVSSYRGQNNNRKIGTCFESGGAGSGGDRIAVYHDGAGSGCRVEKARAEGLVGPFAICDGDQTISGVSQSATFACNNNFEVDYGSSAGQSLMVQQVGGAAGNRMTGVGGEVSHWHSGNLGRCLKARGGVDGSSLPQASITHPDVAIATASPPVLSDWRRYTVFGNEVRAHRSAIVLNSGSFARLGVAVRCDAMFDFDFNYAAASGFAGRPFFVAYDVNGVALSAGATEARINPLTAAAYKNEFYVKASTSLGSAQSLTSAGASYITANDSDGFRSLRVTVRPEVAVLVMGVAGGSGFAAVESMSIAGYATGNKDGSDYPTTDGTIGLSIYPLMPDAAIWQANADPDGVGNVGYYTLGEMASNFNAASAQPMGWVCTNPGWLAPAWAISTAYTIRGLLVLNGGNVYELTTAGTSAGAGGPTGTGSGIADGTCVWKYLATKAAFVPLANIP